MITYSSKNGSPYEFEFLPHLSELEKSVALTLREEEIEEVFSEYRKEAEELDSFKEIKDLEKSLEEDVSTIMSDVPDSTVKQYLKPLSCFESLRELDRSKGVRAEDEAMARFYVSATMPEYTRSRFESARNGVAIGELNHDNEAFSKHYMDVLEKEYGQECALEFYRNTEQYRQLRAEGYGREEAADKMLVDFLRDVETLN